MTTTQEILFGEASQSLVLECELGRPSSVSCQIWPAYADDTATAETDALSGAAAVDASPSTTLSAAAGASQSDPRALTVTSAAGFVLGRRYLLTEDSNGVSEWIDLAGLNGTSLTARHPLRNDYTAGAAIVTTRCTQALSDTWVADVNNLSPTYTPNPTWRARWEVVIGGVTHVLMRGFDVVRYPSRHGVTALDVDRAMPGWIDRLPPDYQADQGRALIDAAYDSVKFELYGDGKADQAVRNPELVARLVIRRCPVELLVANALRGADNAAALEVAERQWRQIYDQTFRAPVAAVDVTGDGGASTVRPMPLWVR